MVWANGNFQRLPENYLFTDIARKVAEYQAAHPDADIIRMGIGDVTRPLPRSVIAALHRAVDEMGDAATFRGYGPEQGYDFLRQAVLDHEFKPRGVTLELDEIFISDGAKSDTGNFTDLFGSGNIIAIPDPVYPVYLDSNIMSGHGGKQEITGEFSRIRFLPCLEENNFQPETPRRRVDIIYLCSPNNPTGAAMTFEQLRAWVEYALRYESLILFDAAYERYITQDGIPHSIYEIKGAKRCAVEFRSYSKTAGFTGTRCSVTVVPKTVTARIREGGAVSLNRMWLRRQCTKFNGTPYIVQRAAEAIYSPEGSREVDENIRYYLRNAAMIRSCFEKLGHRVFGGVNSPYIWLKTPEGMSSWEYFDYLLQKYNIVGTPGAGFGACGEGYFRLTGFGTAENTQKAVARLLG
ncbi:MAG: LL-diaminopimelate aminotransferase [Christensenellales bacterium]|jgi:LL-diaminopimelate aminotransferase